MINGLIQKLKIDSSGVEIFDSVSAGYNKDSTSYFGKVAVGNAGIRGSASFSHISKNNENDYALIPVSYTHLTLPTMLWV